MPKFACQAIKYTDTFIVEAPDDIAAQKLFCTMLDDPKEDIQWTEERIDVDDAEDEA